MLACWRGRLYRINHELNLPSHIGVEDIHTSFLNAEARYARTRLRRLSQGSVCEYPAEDG